MPDTEAGHGVFARRRRDARAEYRLKRLLPGFGMVFGASVLLAGLAGASLFHDQDPACLLARLLLVGAGALGYLTLRHSRSALLAGAIVYLAHTAALTLNALSIGHGVRQGLPLLLAWFACAGLLEPAARRCLRMLAPAACLYAGLALAALPWPEAAVALAGCGAGLLLACAGGRATRRLLEESWRRERTLLHACRYDSLSGAMSRAYLVERASNDVALARRHRRQLAVAMLDLDHFKCINDARGHAAGDAVIRALVAVCRHSLRNTDYIGRLGGEEFVCVMPETDAAQALACAERMRANFAALRLGAGPGAACATVSIGVACQAGHPDLDSLLRAADAALYRAKHLGRNRVVAAGQAAIQSA